MHTPTQPKILVLDDETSLRDLHTDFMQTWGFEATKGSNGLEGLILYYKALRQHTPFDLIVSDIMMPGMTGPEFYRAISQGATREQKVPPIIYVSADRTTEQEQLIVDYPPFALLRKPLNAPHLQEAVTQALKNDYTPEDLRAKVFDLIMKYNTNNTR